MDKTTQEKIIIENGSGRKKIKKLISDENKVPKFLKGKCTISVTANPGILSKVLSEVKKKGLVFETDVYNLRKYFWDIDMSKKGHELGVKEVKPIEVNGK